MLKLIACAALACAASAQAEDKKTDASGTWTWSVPARSGGPDRTNVLTLKVDGDKLTGTLTTPRRGGETVDTAIQEGKVSGADISFSVTREFNGNTMTSKYAGKISGNTIKGKIEFERNGEAQSRDWEAHRQTEKAKPAGSADTSEKAKSK